MSAYRPPSISLLQNLKASNGTVDAAWSPSIHITSPEGSQNKVVKAKGGLSTASRAQFIIGKSLEPYNQYAQMVGLDDAKDILILALCFMIAVLLLCVHDKLFFQVRMYIQRHFNNLVFLLVGRRDTTQGVALWSIILEKKKIADQ